jgi:hypothetical protein
MTANFGYLGASFNNKAQQGFQNSQAWGNNYAQNRQASNQYKMARRGLDVQKGMDAQNQRDKMLGFGVNALAGLMR